MVITQVTIDWLHLFVLTAALGMLLHEAGLISLGHTGVLLGGAYAFGLVAMGNASIGAVAVGLVIITVLLALVVFRVTSDIFAVVTLAFATILYRISVGAFEWTGGLLGMGPIPRPEWLASDSGAVIAAGTTALLVGLIYWGVGTSAFGLNLGATRDNDLVSRSQGIRSGLVRFAAVILTASFAVSVGVLQACYFGLVTPRMGVLEITLQALAAAMLARPVWKQGRPAITLLGYAAASGVLAFTPPLLRQLIPGAVDESILRQAIFGMVLYALVHPSVQGWMSGRSS